MLIRFSLENYLSFKDKVCFSMIPGKGSLKKTHIMEKVGHISVLKTAVIFGANASGKSNLIKAIAFGKDLVLAGTAPNEPIAFEPFKLDSELKPSQFEYEIQHENKNYIYGFLCTKEKIIEEWLYEVKSKSNLLIFERMETNQFDLSYLNQLNEDLEQQQFLNFLAKGTRDNQLFLTELIQRNTEKNINNVKDLLNIIDWFKNVLMIIYPLSKAKGIHIALEKSTDIRNLFENYLQYFDTGIHKINFKEIRPEDIQLANNVEKKLKLDLLNTQGKGVKSALISNRSGKQCLVQVENNELVFRQMVSQHPSIDQPGEYIDFDFSNEESDGTQRLFELIPMLFNLLSKNKVFIIDEIERSLHPNIVYEIVSLFLDQNIQNNENKSQLILASHESILLSQELLRKDEVWFTHKNNQGISHLFSLEEYKVHFGKEIQKKYLQGRFQAVPHIRRSKLDQLNEEA